MRESDPTARATCSTSAPVASQSALIAFIELILWARNAFAVSLLSSLDHKFVFIIFSAGTQRMYIEASVSIAALPSAVVSSPPIRTRSGNSKSLTAVPSARNSGFDNT